jgi:hypothetical protein
MVLGLARAKVFGHKVCRVRNACDLMEVHLAASQVILQPEVSHVEMSKLAQASSPDNAYCGTRARMERRANLNAEIFQQCHHSKRL